MSIFVAAICVRVWAPSASIVINAATPMLAAQLS